MRAGALCMGYGGLELALDQVLDIDLAWYSEYDRHASAILARHWPDVPNLGDLTTIDWTQVEPVDVLTAGYPCQPFSHAGKRKGAADARHLWPHVAAAVRVLRPRLVVLENVGGHLSLGLGDVLGDLAEIGYDARWTCLRAADVGAPHGRLRVFIAAYPGGERHGGGEDPGSVGRVDSPDAGETWEWERSRPESGDRGATVVADSDRVGREWGGGPWDGRPGLADSIVADADGAGLEGRERAEQEHPGHAGRSVVDWGAYGPAIARWEQVLGRCAPAPTGPGRSGPRLSAHFVEWMMGLPAGWVTDVDIPRNAQLKALGNGVVPAQAAAALEWLLTGEDAA